MPFITQSRVDIGVSGIGADSILANEALGALYAIIAIKILQIDVLSPARLGRSVDEVVLGLLDFIRPARDGDRPLVSMDTLWVRAVIGFELERKRLLAN